MYYIYNFQKKRQEYKSKKLNIIIKKYEQLLLLPWWDLDAPLKKNKILKNKKDITKIVDNLLN